MGKAIYDWVVENSEFDITGREIGEEPSRRLAGWRQTLYGTGADIALLFVALCRSVGIPARPVFGCAWGHRASLATWVSSVGTERSAALPRRILYSRLWLDRC